MTALWCLKKLIKLNKNMYRSIKLYGALAIAALAFAQCTKDLNEISVGESPSKGSATKILNSSNSAAEGSLLVKFGEEATLAFENGSHSAGVTRSNIVPLNNVLLDIEATSIERLFPVDEKNEARTREAGLHRWYIVHFDSKQQLDRAARSLADIAEIEKIEFNTKHKMPEVQIAGAVKPVAEATRLSVPKFNDPLASTQWDFNNTGDITLNKNAVAGMDINLHEAWKYTTGDSSIIVAIMDQGVDYTHEDLADNMWVNKDEIAGNGIDDDKNGYVDDIYGYNFVEDGPVSWNNITADGKGDVGHGTHIAGTISAVNNNGIGVNGIAGGDGSGNGVKLMSAQIFSGNSEKNATVAVVSKAFKYAADNGAVLSNNSWGSVPREGQDDSWYMSYNGAQQEAIDYFTKTKNHDSLEGGLAIFAAGNDEKGQASYPGAFRDHIAVTAFAINGMPAYYTNYGPGCNISAPGGDLKHGNSGAIASTVSPIYDREGSKYVYYQGTSMACPHVTGIAALGLAYAKKIGKTLTLEEFKAKLLTSVNDIDNYIAADSRYSSYAGKMGTGRIDAFKVLMNVEGITCIPVKRGKYAGLDITPYLNDGETPMAIIGAKISSADMKSLGIPKAPEIINKKIWFSCANTGSGIIEVTMVAGGTTAGSTTTVGGMTITKRFALVVRDSFAENEGWL